MNKRLFLAVATVTTSILFFQANDVQAQGHQHHYDQGYGNYGQATQYYSYPASQVSIYSYDNYGTPVYYPTTSYSTGYGNYSGHSYRGGNNYRSGYGNCAYRSRGGLSIRFSTGGFGNRGYGGYRGLRY